MPNFPGPNTSQIHHTILKTFLTTKHPCVISSQIHHKISKTLHQTINQIILIGYSLIIKKTLQQKEMRMNLGTSIFFRENQSY